MPLTDPALPGLPMALDIDAILAMLRDALPECREQWELIGGRITDVRYRPGSHCVFQYQLDLRERETQHPATQLVFARVLRADERPDFPPSEQLARYAAFTDKILSTPVVYLPAARMLVYAAPLDPALPWLFDALDSMRMQHALTRLGPYQNLQVTQVTARLLKYRPQIRATFLYELHGHNDETGQEESLRFIGKMLKSSKPAQVFANAWALWQAANGHVGLARPTGYVASLNLTLQEQVPGQSLGEFVTSSQFVPLVQQTANSLAALHSLTFPLFQSRTPQDEARFARHFGTVLMTIHPQLARRIERLRDRLVSEVATRTQTRGPVHGDFHDFNILVDGERLTFIDLEGLVYGDPLVDVGRFLASMRKRALFVFGNSAKLANVAETFLAEYLTRTSANESRARLFETVFLLKSAIFPFESRRPQWQEEITTLVDEAERVFHSATRQVVTSAATVTAKPLQSFAERLRWARDGTYVQAQLDPYLRRMYDVEVTSCHITEEELTENSAHISYKVSGWRSEEPWRGALDGFLWRDRTRRTLIPELNTLRSVLAGTPDALLLPQPVAYLRLLSLVMLELPPGTSFSSLIGTPDALLAATKVAEALALLHHMPLTVHHSRSLEDELLSLHRRIDRLATTQVDLDFRLASVFAEMYQRSQAISYRLAPVLRTLHPSHLLYTGKQVAVTHVKEVTLSCPLIDVGDFLAQLTLLGIKQGNIRIIKEVAGCFRRAYMAAANVRSEDIAVCEVKTLLRLACARIERDPQAPEIENLLDHAADGLAIL